MNKELFNLAKKIGVLLKNKKLKLALAESCTGGLVAATITAIPGSSKYFDRGLITYSNEAKQKMLSVGKNILQKKGAVSVEVVEKMALGALRNSKAQISLAITGIAGPTGGSKAKPVGTVYFGIASSFAPLFIIYQIFVGNREQIRNAATKFACIKLFAYLKQCKK